MSSTKNEDILFEGLNHSNEAVRYWAGQGLYNLNKIKKSTVDRLNQKLDDTIINVSMCCSRITKT